MEYCAGGSVSDIMHTCGRCGVLAGAARGVVKWGCMLLALLVCYECYSRRPRLGKHARCTAGLHPFLRITLHSAPPTLGPTCAAVWTRT